MWSIIGVSIDCLSSRLLIDGKHSVNQHSNESELMIKETNIDHFPQHSTMHFRGKEYLPNNESQSTSRVHKRVKRVVVFRPLFVYRQQKMEQQRRIQRRKELNNQRINYQRKTEMQRYGWHSM